MKTIIGIMGPGDSASEKEISSAFQLGKLLAEQGYVVLTGGRDVGVMEAALKGAKAAGGLTLGILPGMDTSGMSSSVDLPIVTGMGNARNAINILTAHLVIAIGGGPGTVSEIALALKSKKKIILLSQSPTSIAFYSTLGDIHVAKNPEDVLYRIERIWGESG